MSDLVHVPPDGPAPCDIIVCGESPGKVECEQGRGFVGPSGRLLWSEDGVLTAVGLPRESCYVTNTVKTQCPDAVWNAWTEAEREQSLIAIRAEVESVHPKVVMAFGVRACKALVPDFHSMLRQHGQAVRGYGTYWALPMWHPAAYLRGNKDVLGYLIQDALKVGELLVLPVPEPPPTEPAIPVHDFVPTSDEFLEAWPANIATMGPSGKIGRKCTLCGVSDRPLKRYGDRVFSLTLCMRDAIVTSSWAETTAGRLALVEHFRLGAEESFVEKLEQLIARRARRAAAALAAEP